MSPLHCPHCKQPAMSPLAKLSVGPLRPRPCRQCGQSLSVSWLPYTLLALASSLLSFIGVLFAVSFTGGSAFVALLFVVLFAVSALWLHYRWVPFVVRNSPASSERGPGAKPP
jgi:hypothetical protein